MKSTNWKDIAELVGIAAIVASLIFVGVQMKQTQEIALSESGLWTLANTVETFNGINEHAGVWARGNAGADLDDAEAVIYRNLINIENSRAFLTSRQFQRLGLLAAEIPVHEFASFLYQNPGARREWVAQQEIHERYRDPLVSDRAREFVYPYLDSFADQVRSDLEKLDQLYD